MPTNMITKIANLGRRLGAKVLAIVRAIAKAGAAVSLLALILIAIDRALFPD